MALGWAGPLRFLWVVLVPMSGNSIGALAVVQFVYVWDQFMRGFSLSSDK